MEKQSLRIGVVGPCASGKSTLIADLRQRGYQVKHIAQEHSYVQDMWQRLTNPDLLIYLDVSYANSIVRRKMNWSEAEYDEQLRRLKHARAHTDFYLSTDALSIAEVSALVLTYLENVLGQSS